MPGELPSPTPGPSHDPHGVGSPDNTEDYVAETLPDTEDALNDTNAARVAEATDKEFRDLKTFLDQIGKDSSDLTLEQCRDLVQLVRDQGLLKRYIPRARVMSDQTSTLLRRNGYSLDNMDVIERAQAIKASEQKEAEQAALPPTRTPPPPPLPRL